MTSADPVREAAEAYITRCLQHLRELCPADGDTEAELGFPRWLEDAHGEGVITRFGDHKLFRLTPDVWEPARVCAAREVARMVGERLGEYQALVQALESDPIVGGRLGNDVVGGAGLGGGPLQPEVIAQDLVLELVEQSRGFDPSPETVDRAIDRWLGHLRRKEELVIVLAPLSEFAAAAPPIQVGDGVAIDELTSVEVSALLRLGPWTVSEFEPSWFLSQFPPTMMVDRTFAIRLSYAVPVVVDSGTQEQVEASVKAGSDAALIAEEVLLALRLFKPGRVALRGVVSATAQPSGELWAYGGLRSRQPRRLRGDLYVLPAEEGAELAELFEALRAARSHDLIDAASRRFGYAADRSRADDEVVDLVIAAESLFLGDIPGRPSERGEMRFRLSTRAALFTDGALEERRQALTFMRKAYDARSGIVHSGQLNETGLRNLKGDPASAAEFANDLEDLVRRALTKAVRSVASGAGFPPDWDELLFALPDREV